MGKLKTYNNGNYEWWWDRWEKHWVVYLIDKNGDRILWDDKGFPIECNYFPNKTELEIWISKTRGTNVKG